MSMTDLKSNGTASKPVVSKNAPPKASAPKARKSGGTQVNGARVGYTLPIVAPKDQLNGDQLDVETRDGTVTTRTVIIVREIDVEGETWVVAFAEGDIKNMLAAITKAKAKAIKF